VHGDYRLDNMILHSTEPKVLAVLDWELSTLGDPLADFTYHCMQWHMPASDSGAGTGSLVGLDLNALGIPSMSEYVDAYVARTGLDPRPYINVYSAYNFFRLAAILQQAASLYKDVKKDVTVSVSADEELELLVDPEQIRRVIINLIDNAIEAMERRGDIVVETQLDPGNNLVRVVVADDGPGIPPAEREKLFLPYYSTKRRGSGLGLAIVRRIIAEHGGSIEVSDNTPRGTRFTIELPC
jgi:anti-sigma regulatory factor (Ser/Thr protein kinase)